MNRFRSIVFRAVLVGSMAVGAASAQTISVVSGNGQVLSITNFVLQPLIVKVTDANGNPLQGQTVTFTANNSSGEFLSGSGAGTNQTTIQTDSTGSATAVYSLNVSNFPSSNFLTSIAQTAVSASLSNGNSVNFTLTQLLSSPSGNVTPSIQAAFINSQDQETTFPGQSFSGAVGTTSSATIQIHVAATNGQATNAVPGASVELLNYQNPATGPAVACVPQAGDPNAASEGAGTVITDANGNATCTVLFGGQPGTGQFVVAVGGVNSATAVPPFFWQTSPTDPNNPTPLQTSYVSFILDETVTPGSTGSIKIITGNNQTAMAGQALPTPLTIEVDSTSGQPLSGVVVNWTVSPSNAAILSNLTSSTGVNGQTSTSVILAAGASGNITVSATVAANTKLTQSFTITAGTPPPPVTITNFAIVSGNNQSAAVATPFAQPLVVGITVSSGTPPATAVQFAASGPVALSATTATTGSNGQAQVTATALNTVGTATVTATISGVGQLTFNLNVTPPAPMLTAGNFVNGADLQPNSLSPCGIGALVAAPGSLAATSTSASFPGLPVSTTNLSITFSNISAPVYSIGTTPAGQQEVTFQVPCNVTPGASVPVSVSVGAGSTPVNVAVGSASPGIFQTLMSDGVRRAVLVRPDGSFVSLQNPARRGETEVAYVTGLGPTSPPVSTGNLPVPGTAATVTSSVVPGMAGQGVPLVSAQLSEDLPGVYLVSFQIPSSITPGNNVTFSISVVANGTTYSSAGTTIPVQ